MTQFKKLGISVLEASRQRIKNIFSNGVKVYLNVSGGKDSIVISSLVYDLIREGEIDGSLAKVVFIDEEVIYDDVVRICKLWRQRFMEIGVAYEWFTIEHRNNNCFNQLENNENFIPWDCYEKDKWFRPKPKFAISEHPCLVKRVENYQDFLDRYHKDGLCILGIRTGESVNRQSYIVRVNMSNGISKDRKCYPIYDWKDSDVWKYIKDKNLEFPDVYMRMWEAGFNKQKLRVCNLFAIDTCMPLVKLFEVYPDMWEKMLKREPNAYLVRLYWDSEMFRRNTQARIKSEKGTSTYEDLSGYRKKFFEVVNHPKKYFKNPHALYVASQYRLVAVKYGNLINDKRWKQLYECLMAGDTKMRNLRAKQQCIVEDYYNENKVKQKHIVK